MTGALQDAGPATDPLAETLGVDGVGEDSTAKSSHVAEREVGVEVEVEVEPHADPASGETDPADWKVQLARRLADKRLIVDRVLDRVSESRLEARRLVTKELWVDPRPEILNTIVKIACDGASDGLRRELPRHLLTVHSVIELELARLLDAPELDEQAILQSCEILPELRDLARQIQEEISTAANDLASQGNDYLLQVCNSLDVAEDRVSTAMLLAPRVIAFIRAGAVGDLGLALPFLNDSEVGLLSRLFESDPEDKVPGRNCLNSIALRSLMLEDIERWDQVCAGVTGIDESVEVDPDLLQRMSHEKAAFHFISDRLQATQDSALLAGLHGFADEVRGFRQNLFATYLEFTPALRDAARGKASAKTLPDESALLSLIEQTKEADTTADTIRANATSNEELYLRALTDMRRKPSLPDVITSPAAGVRSAKRRMRWLAGVAGVLSAVVIAIHAPLLFAPAPKPDVDVADFAPALTLIETISVGGAMYARVSQWSWEDLSDAERLAKVEALGSIARSRDLSGVMLAGEAGRELAHWNVTDGATLVEPTP